jgi:hypothetical protein
VEKKVSTFGSILPMMFNPAAFLQNYFEKMSTVFSILISGVGFGLFFLQTGLDLYKTGQKPLSFAYTIGGVGFLYGAMMIPFFGILLWIFLKIARSKSTFKQTLCAICLSYSSLLIYSIFGMAFSFLLNWKTSMAFGTTGAVWSTGAMIGTIRQLSNGKTGISIFLSIVFGIVILFSWYYVGNI